MKKKLISTIIAFLAVINNTQHLAFADGNYSFPEPDYTLWDYFIKYDLCISDYDALTDEQKELCNFIFYWEQLDSGYTRYERARRILAGEDVGERIALEQLQGAYGIWDVYSDDKSGWHSYIHCVPDVVGIQVEIEHNQYWLDDADEPEMKVVFTGEDYPRSEIDTFLVYQKYEEEGYPFADYSRCYTPETRFEMPKMPFGTWKAKLPDNNYTTESLDLSEAIEYNGDYYYITPDNKAILLKSGACGTSKEDIPDPITEPHIIPDEINGCPVTAIEDGAFKFAPYTEIVLPETIVFIESEAFYYNIHLEKINFPERLKLIGKRAFFNAAMTELNIDCPELVTSELSFYMPDLTEVVVNCKTIGKSTFSTCKNLKNVSLGNSVTRINDRAFYQCPIENLEFTSSLKILSWEAFCGIDTITLPPSVEIIGAKPETNHAFTCSGADPYPLLTDDPICVFDPDCVINGWYNTEAHRYALEWGLKFNPMDEDVAYGDTNLDGKISMADMVLLQSYLKGNISEIGYEADLLSDGIVDSFDMIKMRSSFISGS